MAFSVTETQYLLLLSRVSALEERTNQVLTAMSNLISLKQVNEITVSFDYAQQALEQKVDAIEERLTSLEEEPL